MDRIRHFTRRHKRFPFQYVCSGVWRTCINGILTWFDAFTKKSQFCTENKVKTNPAVMWQLCIYYHHVELLRCLCSKQLIHLHWDVQFSICSRSLQCICKNWNLSRFQQKEPHPLRLFALNDDWNKQQNNAQTSKICWLMSGSEWNTYTVPGILLNL